MVLGPLSKAKLIIYGESGLPKETLNCAFNPSQYVIKNTTQYHEENGLADTAPQLTFLSQSLPELTLTLFFDSMAEGVSSLLDGDAMLKPVTASTEKIAKAMKITGSMHAPPMVAFLWGNLNFAGVITNMTETFTMFSTFGKPIRAKVDLTIKAKMDGKVAKSAEPFESPDRTKYQTFTEGMSLWALAYEEYGDCEKWRIIAKANQLMNPLDVRPGQIIKIPPI